MGVAERNKDICNVWPTCKLKVTPALFFFMDLIPDLGRNAPFKLFNCLKDFGSSQC